MIITNMRTVTVLFTLACLGGCGLEILPDSLGSATDADRDGFVDILPPPGAPLQLTEDASVKVALINELTVDDLKPYAADYGVDPGLLEFALITIKLDWTIVYAEGVVQQFEDTERLEPFQIAFEVACHQSASLDASAVVNGPIPGTQPVTIVPLDVSIDDVEYTCGQTIEVRTFISESGQIDHTVEVR